MSNDYYKQYIDAVDAMRARGEPVPPYREWLEGQLTYLKNEFISACEELECEQRDNERLGALLADLQAERDALSGSERVPCHRAGRQCGGGTGGGLRWIPKGWNK